ncbi:type VI secretion system protein TssA [Massilia endophytica]|uniref:type VI secretion system protein TssA n=1 Tax=Massilia endophytica TaxID=2899220 RepID=UPI001E39252B|nr:type VI secretion system protein TssA [Massilia endophytica]UGQ44825.1 type VI secretion system protein TssA [Massilia endophytica]
MFDIERLLLPVSVQQECGEDLAFSKEMDDIARAREHDDPSLDQGEWIAALKEADWELVAKRCEELIQARSKDLQLAVWLAEALAHTRGFKGLGDGYALIAALVDRYWDALHPLAEEGDCERRIGNLCWLAKRSPELLKAIPVSEDGAISLADFEAARQRSAAARSESATDSWHVESTSELPDVAQLDAHRRRNSESFNHTLLADARHCLETLQQLEVAVDARLGASGPGFSAARAVLHDAVDFIAILAPSPEEAPAAQGAAVERTAAEQGALRSRQQALAQLRRVADFFRQTEPHSPVAYLADKAASWGEMPLHDWLHSVIKDPVQAGALDELLGVRQEAAHSR